MRLTLASLAFVAACGDDLKSSARPDAPPVDPDAAPDAPPDANPYVPPAPFAVPISAAGPDQLQSLAPGPDGTFYAAGFSAATVAGVRNVIVVKLTATGLDTTFGGGDGIATTTTEFKGGSDEIDIAVQSTGKIVVSATVANAGNANDRDVAVLRLLDTGEPDPDFGVAGVRVLDLNTAHDNGTMLVGLDSARSIAIGPGDVIFVHALQRGEGTKTGGGPRTDTDFAVTKLSADGAPELAYGGGDGKYLLDITESNATPKGLTAFADGTVIANGYANSPGLGTVQPVLFKLSAVGEPVTAFADQGLFHETVLQAQTEIYGVAVHGNNLVTGGYGREVTDAQNDWVSLRFDATTGARDLTWGGTTNGAVVIDPAGMMAADNCRNAIALPGGKTALIGSTGPGNVPEQNAVFAILAADGTLDPAFGGKAHVYPLGANGNDQFWGGAVSGGKAMIVGYKGGGMTQTETVNDDAWAIVLPVE